MSVSQKRATVYFDPDIHKALKIKSLETSKSLSELVNRAVKELLAEDAEDIDDIEKRADDKLISYAEMVKRLKKDGRI
ncbi:MAG: CopG family transcriptional regulator [Candidatus Dadabacteria bacterium]|nr:CopG family transcriptional regulator [Candidatus Dadabacteria bacterium]NIS08838.1 CopG family transcriptional regulator [Candidatus Dadabacteria bacterium]NIY22188.1 CopG family transcriptional regulator [Candidatus Dadabacteria bacterium]